MTSLLATLVCVSFIGYMIVADLRRRDGEPVSWAPLVWMFLAGSRWVSSWFNLGTPTSVDDYSDGSPVDRLVFASLIGWGVVVLLRRRIRWPALLGANLWMSFYLLFTLGSILWSDEPFLLAKRWFKDLGNPIMALVLLTEPRRPYEAVGIVLRRLAILLLPLSVLFVRYYPELGRTYRPDGSPMYTGVGHQKNDLGLMCLITGVYFFWKMLQRRTGGEAAERMDAWDLALLGMLLYLLRVSNSQTSLACLALAVLCLLVARLPVLSAKASRVVPVLVCGVLGFAVLDVSLNITDTVLGLLGRDSSLTNRTELWSVVRGMATNPVVGAGFMSFWSGPRMSAIWAQVGNGVVQAHNGYLEQYLNLGYVGVFLIVALMASSMMTTWRKLGAETSAGLLRLCFLVVAVLYNYTEAAFYGINNMWVMLLVACINVPPGCIEAPAVERAAGNVPASTEPVVVRRRAWSPQWAPIARHRS